MLDINDRTTQRESHLGSAVAAERPSYLALLVLLRSANDRSGHPFLVYRSAFQAILLASGSHVPRTENLVWSLSAIALMQAGYWIGCRLRPPLLGVRNTFIGHVILFVARMSFVLGTSVFGFVFIVRRPEFYIPTSRYVVLIMGLFALFCYTHELEQLG
jgi:hypothetical protein